MFRKVWLPTLLSMVLELLHLAAWLHMPAVAEDRDDAQVTLPHWIWHCDTSANDGVVPVVDRTCRLEHRFSVDQLVQSATMRLAADFCGAIVVVNGVSAVRLELYSPTIDMDVTTALRSGPNHVAISAESVGGPAAVAMSLTIVTAKGQRSTIVTDERWSVSSSGRAVSSMGRVDDPLWGIGRRPAAIDPFENYEQWRQALGTPSTERRAAFWTAPGFEISLVRTAQPDEGSWVSMAFDPQGRLTIAREDMGLLRMTLDAARRSVERVETINDDLQECRGLLYAYESLYVNANNSKGLYRLRDVDRDDHFDEVRLLRQFPGSVGHGRNDLALGPDGMIYSIHGDAVDLPTTGITDHTSPYRESRRGQPTREGHVIRTDRDGQQWELVCAGLRNPFGIAFSSDGEAFTYDADAEFDMGTPWYRPTRIVQLLPGADYGWRGVTGKWPPYFPDHPDNALHTLDIGKGSPTAVAFGTETKFPWEYRNALFVLDWAYGRILAVHLAPRGAGFRAQAETFLQGRPLNVTDLAVGPDGALYLVTGGRKTQSSLYRVAYTGSDLDEKQRSPHEKACQRHAAEARTRRRSLENYSRTVSPSAVTSIWPHLDSPDPAIRHAARITLEHQPVETWRDLALAEGGSPAGLTALLALARAGDKADIPAIVDRLLGFSVKDLNVTDTLTLLHTYSLCLQNDQDALADRKQKAIEQLDAVFPLPVATRQLQSPAGTGGNVQRQLAQVLTKLGAPSVVEKTARSLLTSNVQEDRLHALLVLRDVREGWSQESRRAYFNALNEGARFVRGEGMPRFLAKLREESLATLSDDERQQLADRLAPPEASSEHTGPAVVRPLVKNWSLDDFLPVLQDPSIKGEAERGAAIFRDALCIRCHRSGAVGPAVGPDLTHISSRFGRRDVLDSMLNPSQVVAENYRNVQVRTSDGRTVVGRVLIEGDYRSEIIRIATDPLQPTTIVELKKQEVDEIRESETSAMPKGLLDTFRLNEIIDLLSFLEAGAKANATRP